MQIQNKTLKTILPLYKEISLLNKMLAVLGWDQNVNLPAKAAQGRADQIAYLTQILTEKWLDPVMKKTVESLKEADGTSGEEKAMIRNLQYASEYYYKIPKDIIIKKSKVSSEAFMAWQKARVENDFPSFQPYLEQIIELNKQIAQHLGYEKNPYDAHLHLHEPGLTTKLCADIFGNIRPRLTQLLSRIQKSEVYRASKRKRPTHDRYQLDYQKQLSEYVLHLMGYDFQAGRMDISAHPFTTTMDRYDVRITTRYDEFDFRECYTSSVHEGGHALYEQGVNPEYDYTPLEGGVSMGIHESQSRFYENMVGRSPAFLQYLMTHFQKYFPKSSISSISELTLYLNEVEPGLIRTKADEVTYNLHIILRFEIENGLLNNKMQVKDLPEIWNSHMKQFLDVEPTDDRDGVLQDVHWSYGEFGYFPTYSLGNLYSAQIAKTLQKEIPMKDPLESGNLGEVHEWLKKNIYHYGSLYWPNELISRVTGEKLNPDYFIEYLTEKYERLYSLT